MTIDSGQKLDLQMVKQSCLDVSSSISMAVLTGKARFWANDKKEKKITEEKFEYSRNIRFPKQLFVRNLRKQLSSPQDPSIRQ